MVDAALYAYLGVAAALFVLWDATRRRAARLGWRLAWTAAAALGWPLALPVWLAARPLRPGERRRGGRAWNVLRHAALAWTVLWGAHALVALGVAAAVARSDRTAADRAAGLRALVRLAVLHGLVWGVPALGALVLGLVLRRPGAAERGPD